MITFGAAVVIGSLLILVMVKKNCDKVALVALAQLFFKFVKKEEGQFVVINYGLLN